MTAALSDHAQTNRLPFQAIAAMAENRVIGDGNRIPWHLPEDFKWFKKKTMGHRLVMGRRTFESIGRPLPGRETVVLSRQGYEHSGVRVVSDLSALLGSESGDERISFICGGGEIYRLALPYCSDLFLTRVKRMVDGDCLFPAFEADFRLKARLHEDADFVIEHYVREH